MKRVTTFILFIGLCLQAQAQSIPLTPIAPDNIGTSFSSRSSSSASVTVGRSCSESNKEYVSLNFLQPDNINIDFNEDSKKLTVRFKAIGECFKKDGDSNRVGIDPAKGKDGNIYLALYNDIFTKTVRVRNERQEDESAVETQEDSQESEIRVVKRKIRSKERLLSELTEPENRYKGFGWTKDKSEEYLTYERNKHQLEREIADLRDELYELEQLNPNRPRVSSFGQLWGLAGDALSQDEGDYRNESAYLHCLKEKDYIDDEGNYTDKLNAEALSEYVQEVDISNLIEDGKRFNVFFASNTGFPAYRTNSSLLVSEARLPDNMQCFRAEKIGGENHAFLVRTPEQMQLAQIKLNACLAQDLDYLEQLRRQAEVISNGIGDHEAVIGSLQYINNRKESLQNEEERAVIARVDEDLDSLNALMSKITDLDNDLADMECDLAEDPRERKQCVRRIEAVSREITKEFNSFTRASIAAQRELANEIWSLEGQMRRTRSEDQRLRIEERLDELKIKFQSIVDLQEVFAAGDSTFAFWDQMKSYGIVNNYASVMKNAIELEMIVEESYDHDVPSDEKFAQAKQVAQEWEQSTYSEVIRPVLIATNRIWTTGNGREAMRAFDRQVESLEGSLQRCRQVTSRSCQQKRRDCRVPLSYCDRSVGEGLSIARAQRSKVGSLYSASIRLSRSDAARSRRSGGGIFTRGLEDYGLGGSDYGLDPRGARGRSYGRDPMERLASTSWIPGSSQRPGMPQNHEQSMYCQSQGLEFNPQTNMCAPPKKKFFDGYAYGSANMNMGFRGAAQGQFMGQGNIFAPGYGYGYGHQPYGYPMMMNPNTNYMYPQTARPIMPGGMPGYGRMPSGMPYGY